MDTVFFAGTDTEVGKTHVAAGVAAALVARRRRVGVYKPVASGCRVEEGETIADDALRLWDAASRPRTLHEVCPQRFRQPLAPAVAAAAERRRVDVELMRSGFEIWRQDPAVEILLVEGAGGLFSPISEAHLNIDFAESIQADRIVLVAADRLGVAHQVLSTIEATRHRGRTIAGVVLNRVRPADDGSHAGNAEMIRRFTDVPIWATIRFEAGPENFVDLALRCLGPAAGD